MAPTPVNPNPLPVGRARRIGFVTFAGVPQITPDDALLADALRCRGAQVDAVVWSDTKPAALDVDVLVLRSCWDYHLRADEFGRWLDATADARPRLINDAALVRWNMRKTYLRELANAHVPIVPSVWVERGRSLSLAEILDRQDWESAVVKPVVAATAHNTWRVTRPEADGDAGERFRAEVGEAALIVQPFVDAVVSDGEWSLMFVDGRYSHAVLKRAAAGDFRVQSTFGGTFHAAAPTPDMVEAATRAIRAAPSPPVYARVDGVCVGGQFLLMELELIEPVLFFGTDAGAADRLAEAVLSAPTRQLRQDASASRPVAAL